MECTVPYMQYKMFMFIKKILKPSRIVGGRLILSDSILYYLQEENSQKVLRVLVESAWREAASVQSRKGLLT